MADDLHDHGDSRRCALCERQAPVSAHHLIPRSVHGKKRYRERFGIDEMRTRRIPLCRHCHRAVHEFIPDAKTLADSYNTLDALLAHPDLARHIEWARKQRR